MTDSAKIINEVKKYIIDLFQNGLNSQQQTALKLKNGIDLFIGKEFRNIQKLKAEIIHSCENELVEHYNNPRGNDVFRRRIDVIRNNFIDFVNSLDLKQIEFDNQLPYERRLNADESKKLRKSLKNIWDFDGWNNGNYYWEPIAETKNSQPLIYFEAEIFSENDIERVKQMISKIYGNRIFKLTEDMLDYEIEYTELSNDWIESAFTDKSYSWLIYFSHEGTLTFSGKNIIQQIDLNFPEKNDYKNPWN